MAGSLGPMSPPFLGGLYAWASRLGESFWSVATIKTVVYQGLYWGAPSNGNYHAGMSIKTSG